MISIILPAYNEEASIKDCIVSIKDITLYKDYEIIVVNDGSTDRTYDILQSIQDITVINNPYNLGYGASIKKGIKHASGNWILIMDTDGTYPAEDIPKLSEWINEYDMVVGTRTRKISLRHFAKLFLTFQANFLTNKKITDLNSELSLLKK